MQRHPDGPRFRINPQEQSKPGAAKMTTFLGKYWFVHSLLWLMAGGLCFVVWPKLALWPEYSLLNYVSSEPVVLYYDQDRSLMAWDYEADKRWSVAGLTVFPGLRIQGVGDKAIAMWTSDQGLRVVEIAPPHEERTYALPSSETEPKWLNSRDLILVTANEKFAVVRETTTKGEVLCVAIDLAKGEATDKLPAQGIVFGVPESDQIEQRTDERNQGRDTRTWSRWRLDEHGHFVGAPVPTSIVQIHDMLNDSNRRWRHANASRDDQFIVRAIYNRVEVFRPSDNSVVSRFGAIYTVDSCYFTRNDTRVVTLTSKADIEVWNAHNGEKVAEMERWNSISRLLRTIALCSIAGFVVACALAYWADSPRICLYDFVLAITFWLIFRSSDRFRQLEAIDEAISTVNFLAIVAGVYWGVGPGPLWSRIWQTVPLMIPILLGLSARLSSEAVYGGQVHFHPIEIARQCIIPVVSAIASCLVTVPLTWFGYHVANDIRAARRSGWKLHLDSIFALITVVAIGFGFFQLHLTAWDWRDQKRPAIFVKSSAEKAEFAFEILYMTALGAAPIAVLLAWLGLWQWTRWRTVVFTIIGVLIGIALVLAYGDHLFRLAPKTFGYWGAMGDVAATFLLPVATLAIPFVVARRAGYRWVRPAPIPAAETPPQAGG